MGRFNILSAGCLFAAYGAANAATAPPGYGWKSIPSEANVQIGTDPSGNVWPWRIYKSSSFTPPKFNITGNGGALADGYAFLTPGSSSLAMAAKQSANFMMTSAGELVYGQNTTGTTDFRKQIYNGKPHLTFWSGYNTNGANVGHGYGNVTFLDQNYSSFVLSPKLPLNTLLPANVTDGFVDIHEHQMTARNTIMLTAYNNSRADLSAYNGPRDGWIADAIVYEVDIATQKILFQWRSSDHVPFSDSKLLISNRSSTNGTMAAPWDYFHVNSIEMVGDDHYLINSRHCWAFFLVAKQTGKVVWSLEGETGGSFAAVPANGTFRWQHDVRAHNVTATGLDVSFFDNHNNQPLNLTAPTKQLVYHLPLPASKSAVPLLRRRIETPAQLLYSVSQGSYKPDLPNGNQFVGFGALPVLREYGPAVDGSDLRWEAQFGPLDGVQSYRGYRETWHATPAAWDPSLVVAAGKAYVSWNGATEVQQWHVYTGASKSALKPLGSAAKKGFETTFALPKSAKFVQVAAVQGGKEVRRSNVVAV